MEIRTHKIAVREPVYSSFNADTRSYDEWKPLPSGVLVSWQTLVSAIGFEKYSDNLIAHSDSKALYVNGSGVRGRVIAKSSGYVPGPRDTGESAPGARRSYSGRRTIAACWHAYRDVLLAVFDIDPCAVVVTSMARYEGRQGFLGTYPATADINVGSLFCPAYMPEQCEC